MTNHPNRKQSKVAQAYVRAKPIRDALHEIGRCMEVTEDKAGIVWERWLVGQTQVITFSTPHYVEVFQPIIPGNEWADLIGALRALATRVA